MPVPVQTKLPRVEPIVPTARPQPFNDPAWMFEPKYDGFRRAISAGPGVGRVRQILDDVGYELDQV